METQEVKLELQGVPLWAVPSEDFTQLTIHVDLHATKGALDLVFSPGPREAQMVHALTEPMQALWRELYQRHPDLLGCFLARDRFQIKGRGTVWVVSAPLGTHIDDLAGWGGRPVMLDGVVYTCRGVESHRPSNRLIERWPIGILVSEPLEWQFPGAKPPEAPGPRVTMWKASPEGEA